MESCYQQILVTNLGQLQQFRFMLKNLQWWFETGYCKVQNSYWTQRTQTLRRKMKTGVKRYFCIWSLILDNQLLSSLYSYLVLRSSTKGYKCWNYLNLEGIHHILNTGALLGTWIILIIKTRNRLWYQDGKGWKFLQNPYTLLLSFPNKMRTSVN